MELTVRVCWEPDVTHQTAWRESTGECSGPDLLTCLSTRSLSSLLSNFAWRKALHGITLPLACCYDNRDNNHCNARL